ncbi:hypothetical protein BH09BAC6_BH09BAC6_27350 [soil metagenome]|jgi:pimeloyl-ACP methyl ester carboxylesterase
MKKVIFFTLILLVGLHTFAQSEPANYTAVLTKFTRFYNNSQPDSIFTLFSPELKAALPLEKFKPTTLQLKSQLGNLVKTDFVKYNAPLAVYKATFQNNVFLLNLSLDAKNKLTGLLLSPNDEPATARAPDPGLTESPVLVKTLSGAVSGTLTMPVNVSGKIPVVLIIAGAGPTDRNGNNPKLGIFANEYKMLAAALGKSGIASLRYDKRMVGESVTATKESQLHFEDYVDDAVVLINYLNDDQRFSKIIILGHGEGSLVGIIAVRDQPVKAFISVSGASESGDKIMTEQMKSQPQFMADGFKSILDSLKKGKITDKIDPALYYIARPSIQPFIMTWCRYHPDREIKKIKVPVLILQGNTDMQATVADAEKLKKAKSDAALVIIPNMNYILKDATADKQQNTATYAKEDLPLKPELVTTITQFIEKLR